MLEMDDSYLCKWNSIDSGSVVLKIYRIYLRISQEIYSFFVAPKNTLDLYTGRQINGRFWDRIVNIMKMDIPRYYLRLFPGTHHGNALSLSTRNYQSAGPCLYDSA